MEFYQGAVCLGVVKKNNKDVFRYLSLNNLSVFEDIELVDTKFNLKKYKEFSKYSRNIYTVVAEIYDERYISTDGINGYLVSDNHANFKLVNEDELGQFLKGKPCMNFSTSEKNGIVFARRNPGVELPRIEDKKVRDLVGYCFDDLCLREEMSLSVLVKVMEKYGFKIGYRKQEKYNYFSTESVLNHIIFVDKEGTLFEVNEINGKLNYVGCNLIQMRHYSSEQYSKYLRKNPYSSNSTTPIDGVKTDIILLTSSDIYKVLRNISTVRETSKGCKPYYLSESLDGALSMLVVSPKEKERIEEEVDVYYNSLSKKSKEKTNEYVYRIIASEYLGYKRIKKYEPFLQKFYSNYLENFEKYMCSDEMLKRRSLSNKELDKFIKFIDSCKIV